MKCGINKNLLNDFYVNNKNIRGRTTECKSCLRDKQKKYVEDNHERVIESLRTFYYLRKYGLTLDNIQQMIEDQDSRCAICLRVFELIPGRQFPLVVDHNHETGEVRGMLCIICNHRILGGAKDDADILERAVRYLRGNGWEALKKQL